MNAAPKKKDNKGLLIIVFGAALLLLVLGGKKAAAKFKVGDCVFLIASPAQIGVVLQVIAQTTSGFAYSVKFATATSTIPEAQLAACTTTAAVPGGSLTGDITLTQISALLGGRMA